MLLSVFCSKTESNGTPSLLSLFAVRSQHLLQTIVSNFLLHFVVPRSEIFSLVPACDFEISSSKIEIIPRSQLPLINAIQSFGTSFESPLYVQFCPMANNDKGATWISREEEIINPYFGDVMLNCGNVEEVIENE